MGERGLLSLVAFDVLVQVLHHHDRNANHRADRDRDSTERHDIRAQPEQAHREERHQDSDWKRNDRYQRAGGVKEKYHRDQCDDEGFLRQLAAKCLDCPVDQARPVVAFDESHARRQRALDLGHSVLNAIDHRERILSVPHDDPPGHHFSLPVEVRDSAPDLRPDLNVCDVADSDWRPARARADRHRTNVIEAPESAAAAHHHLRSAHLEHSPSNVGVRPSHGFRHLAERNVECQQLRRIHVHLILLLEPAERCDLRHPRHGGERGTHGPVL